MSFDLQPISVNEEQWRKLRDRFASDGVDVPDSASGEIHQTGISVSFTYNGSTLRITVVDKPFLYPERVVKEHLTDYITKAIS